MKTTTVFVAGAVLAAGLGADSALAMPVVDIAPAMNAASMTTEARWVCPPYRPCFWAPGYGYGYGRGYGYGYGHGYGWGHGYRGYGWGHGHHGYGGWRRY